MIDLECERCGALFRVPIFDRWRGRRFCSERCRKAEEARRYRERKRFGDG